MWASAVPRIFRSSRNLVFPCLIPTQHPMNTEFVRISMGGVLRLKNFYGLASAMHRASMPRKAA